VVGGSESGISVDICERELSPDDVLLLCTDSLTGELSDSHIQRLVTASSTLGEAGNDLIRVATTNGGNDNITVGLFRLS
jgi:protein phosphatase